jgi:hypothetical protein
MDKYALIKKRNAKSREGLIKRAKRDIYIVILCERGNTYKNISKVVGLTPTRVREIYLKANRMVKFYENKINEF